MRMFQRRWFHLLCLLTVTLASNSHAQVAAARTALEDAARAMGGLERLQQVSNFQYSGFGQRYSANGNISPDPETPPKWQAVVDATRTFDLRNGRALNRERNSFEYPLAASFGHSWALGNTPQQGAAMLDHPLSALVAALGSETQLGAVTTERGYTVVQFTLANGETLWIALDPLTHLPYWTRRIAGDGTLGDVAYTTYFTGYVNHDGIELPLGIHTRMDWRNQSTLMFQVDSYRLNVELPEFPPARQPANAAAPIDVQVTAVSDGVWDLRVMGGANTRGGDGGLAMEFSDHLVLFEAYGSEAATLARIDAANDLVPGKQVTHIIVTHHHSDHAAGVRAAVSRGLTIIGERENEALYREWVARSAANFPDALQRAPQPLSFLAVDEKLVMEDAMRRLEIYHVIGHPHMGNAVFAYLPQEQLLMEGDLSDVNWEWHWWAYALQANITHYDLEPERIVPVHGEILDTQQTLARIQQEAEAAQAFCESQKEEGYRFFGCPVRYGAYGPLP
jgi:hypothetical protein